MLSWISTLPRTHPPPFAAVVCQLARDTGGPPIRFQLRVYPATDARMGWLSMKEKAKGYFLTAADMRWFYGHYGAPPEDPLVSPLLQADLAGLPPAMVITAQYDPLRDEGDAYAIALRDAGVQVEHVPCAGMIHGFFGMGADIDAAGAVLDRGSTRAPAARSRWLAGRRGRGRRRRDRGSGPRRRRRPRLGR
jgi:acetyl esterase